MGGLKAQNGWFQSSSINALPYTIVGLKFTTLNDGFLIANYGTAGYVYKTADGGNSWVQDTFFTHSLFSLEIINGNYYVGGAGGNLYKKSGASSLWASLSSGTTSQINDIQFTSTDTGFAVGVGGVFRKTVNGGVSWTNPWVGGGLPSYDFNAVYFTDGNNGVAVGVYNFFQGFTVKSISGGAYWGTPATTPSKINEVCFTSSQIGYAIGNGGIIYKTTNAGTGWILKTSGVTSQLWDLSFLNDTVGYVVGDNGTILKTLDGGNTWQQQSSPFSYPIKAVFAVNPSLAWGGGDTSAVIKTITGGLSLSVNVADTTIFCNSYTQLQTTTNYNGIGTLQYSWASNPLLNDTAIANPIAGPVSIQTTFILTVTDGLLSASDTAVVNIKALPPDTICLVSVFDSINHNVIVFEKHILGAVDYYIIHKETNVANVYDSIGFIPADSAGIFVDTAVNPMVQAYRYKISLVDSCGNHSIMSNHHKTIHLTINQGLPGTWNLIWNNYEGVFINTYRIWRGTNATNMTLLDSVAGNMTSYTDLTPPLGSVFYQIEIVSSYMCLPYDYKAQTNYNTSRSNKANTGAPPTVTADFSAVPTTGNAPLTVFFTDNSIGMVDGWLWEFGDGDTAMTANPAHTYQNPGVFDVKLFVKSGILIDSIIKTAFIDVVSSIEDIDLDKALKLYPNPTSKMQNITIEAGGAIISSVEVFDVYGRLIDLHTDINSNKIELKTENYSGVLNLRITSVGGKIANRRIIIQ